MVTRHFIIQSHVSQTGNSLDTLGEIKQTNKPPRQILPPEDSDLTCFRWELLGSFGRSFLRNLSHTRHPVAHNCLHLSTYPPTLLCVGISCFITVHLVSFLGDENLFLMSLEYRNTYHSAGQKLIS